MSNILQVLKPQADGTRYAVFFCPGCKYTHSYLIDRPEGVHPCWSWNRSETSPTFSPSLLMSNARDTGGVDTLRCHLYVTDGRIQFLQDCAHELRGQTVDMPILPLGWRHDE